RDGLLVAVDLRPVACERFEVIGERIEGVVAAVVLFALLALGFDICVDPELDVMPSAIPAHVVEDLVSRGVINKRAVGVAANRADVSYSHLCKRTNRRLNAVVIYPLAAKLVQESRREHGGQPNFHALAGTVERSIVGFGIVGLPGLPAEIQAVLRG